MLAAPPLPEELLGLIFSHLAVSPDPYDGVIELRDHPLNDCQNQNTLANLCLVSKQFCRLSLPLLYREIQLFEGAAEASYKLQKLVRTLIYQPAYAGFINKLCVDSVFLEDDQHEEDSSWDLSYEEAIGSSYAFEHDAAYHEDILKYLRHGSNGAHAALLLTLCRDAESMSLNLPADFYGYGSFAEYVLSYAGHRLDSSDRCEILVLPSLKVLSIYCSGAQAASFSDVANLFQLPRLEEFRGHSLDCTAEKSRYDSFTSNLKRVALDGCLVDAGGLKVILQACSQLQVLAISWADSLLGDCVIDFHEMGRQLSRHGKSLKELTFDLTLADFDYHDSGGLGDVSQMSSLENMAVPADVLVGRSARSHFILPVTLQCLDVDISGLALNGGFWRHLQTAVEYGQSHKLMAVRCHAGWPHAPDVYWSSSAGFA